MRRIIGWGLALVLVAVLAAAAYVWLSITGYFVHKRTPAELLALLEPDIVISKPDGAGPFPAILLYSGCEGLFRDDKRLALMGIYSDLAVAEGVVAIVVDSFTPRGIGYETAVGDVCSGWLLRGAERAGDVAVTIPFARDLPYVDPERLAVAGWSHGGWTVMDFLAMPPDALVPQSLTEWPEDPFAGLTSVYLTYPYCGMNASGFPTLAPSRGFAEPLPVWAIHGTADTTADPVPCHEAYARVLAEGAPVDTATIEGATHAFDRPDVDPASTSKYNPEFAEIAYRRFRHFLRDVLIPGREGF
ncbi:dienelactone hydrolase family protein [Microbaculum marinum]|uniref:Prolyl oligopeptidase family serine peptidase n=1 Tax=Microbaculum marinum TaxID=1764581 RepID=A0AAW9RMN8_9HYPH